MRWLRVSSWSHGPFFPLIIILNLVKDIRHFLEREASHAGAAISALPWLTSCFSPCFSQFPDVSAVSPDFCLQDRVMSQTHNDFIWDVDNNSHYVNSFFCFLLFRHVTWAAPLMVTIRNNKFINTNLWSRANGLKKIAYPFLASVIKDPVESKPSNTWSSVMDNVWCVRLMWPHTVARRRPTPRQRSD